MVPPMDWLCSMVGAWMLKPTDWLLSVWGSLTGWSLTGMVSLIKTTSAIQPGWFSPFSPCATSLDGNSDWGIVNLSSVHGLFSESNSTTVDKSPFHSLTLVRSEIAWLHQPYPSSLF